MSADWKFASAEGFLNWTLPALPSGGQRLYSKLSPTILAAHIQANDAAPVDYIDIPAVTGVTLRSSTGVQVDMRDGDSRLLVADTADDARRWYDALMRAARGVQEFPHHQHESESHGVQTSPVVPPQQSAFDASGASYASLSQELRAQRERQELQQRNLDLREAMQREEDERIRREQAALRDQQQHQQQQQQQRPASRTSSPGLPPRAPASQSQSQASPSPYPQPQYNPNQYQQQDQSFSQQQQQQQQIPDVEPYEQRFSATPSLALDTSSHSHQPSPSGPTVQTSTGQRFRPLSIDQQQPQQSSSLALDSSTGFGSRPLPEQHARHLHVQSGGFVPTRNVNDNDGSNPYNNTSMASESSARGFAQTTTVATHEERPVPGSSVPVRPLDALNTTPSLRNSGGGNGLGFSRPLDPNGQQRYSTASAYDASAARYSEAEAAAAAYRQPQVAPTPARMMSEGPRPAGGRGSMMVSVPSTQAENRNIAPNASAVWKQWTGPEGATYFFHEPTKTLQRLMPGGTEYETLVEGSEDVPDADLRQLPHYEEGQTTVDLNTQTVRNLNAYGNGGGSINEVRAPGILRTEALPPQPRGAYSPSRRAPMEALTAPRVQSSGYQGKRLHRLTLQPAEEPGSARITLATQTLDSENLTWDRSTGTIQTRDPRKLGEAGSATLHRQWEHVRKILCQGRYFKKHALRSDSEAFRFVFLTADNAHVCCVPTSQVMLNVHKDPKTFGSAADTVQYYGADTKAMSVNSITHVVLGTEEPLVNRRRGLDPECTFVIVGRTHALILECNTAQEARFWCDAWNFFLEYSKPVNPKATRTPQMVAPVTYNTRGGVAF